MKRILSVLLMLCLAVALSSPTTASEEAVLVEYELLENGTARITAYNGTDTVWRVPQTVDGYTVTEIGEGFCVRSWYPETVVLPDTVTAIRSYAFAWSNVKSVALSSALTVIEDYAFYGCRDLSQMVVPSSVLTIGDYALGYKSVGVTDDNGLAIPGGHQPELMDSFLLIADRNETAVQYAFRNGIRHQTTADFDKGDVDFDGCVDTADARALLLELMWDSAKPTLVNDLNGNRKVDTADVRLILQTVVLTA